jgi:signal peptidase I
MAMNEEETLGVLPPEAQPEPSTPADGQPVSLARAFGGRSVLREIAETVLLTLIIFLSLNATTGRFQVRGSSMVPTLHDGQYLVISKLIYWIHPPERGDIIVFRPPNNPDEDYIKRVVGLPGEQIKIQNGELWVDNVSFEEPYIANPGHYSGSWNLRAGEYFVLGDNRSNSSDSHSWGTLPRENIVGKAWLCYWPPEEWGLTAHHVFPEIPYRE